MVALQQEGRSSFRSDEIPARADDRPHIELIASSPTTNNPSDMEPSEPEPEKAYSIYTKREKWYMVAMVALAGLFSSLAVALYFPAIPTLAAAFGKSTELINLTVTIFMVLQGISPMAWGIVADRLGRRPVYLMCLTLLVLSSVGLALVPTNAYWLLMVLRCFQAAGSASMLALGAGVITDIAAPAERGGFLGLYTLGSMIGPCVGPMIGGLLSGSLGWRSIFWFLAIATGLMLVFMGLTFPETLRAITGDGSLPPQKWNRTPLPILGKKTVNSAILECSSNQQGPQRRSPRPLQILRAFTQPDVLIILICTGFIYSVFYSVPATTATLLQNAHPYLTEISTGLCFIPLGVGGALGSVGIGKILDYDWRKMEARYSLSEPKFSTQSEHQDAERSEKGNGDTHIMRSREGLPPIKREKQDLPIEHTRLKRVPIIFFLEMATFVGYGWSIQKKAPLAIPLVLQFFVGLVSLPMMTIHQTILVDMYPSQASSIIASSNIVRCLLGAATMSVQEIVIKAVNPGWTYVLFCGICVLNVPAFVVEWRYGEKWRKKRAATEKN
ncbi:hypothetical protein FRC12_015323 [Ceratobasidium sp. 428]|nr:hypothetical protein FRC09_020610 [Ceratobasidium sp. 395]KAG8742601.1 hypothetical protein FRC12_015323 [Ceratobasidium sp. 428]